MSINIKQVFELGGVWGVVLGCLTVAILMCVSLTCGELMEKTQVKAEFWLLCGSA